MFNHENKPLFLFCWPTVSVNTKFFMSTELSETSKKKDMTIQTLILKYVTDSGVFLWHEI